MATTGQKWLIGCSLGCGGVLLLLVVGLVLVGFAVKQTVDDATAAKESRKELEQAVGPSTDFAPKADGEIPAERLEVFLAVRKATQQERADLAETWSGLPLSMEQARELENQPWWDRLMSVLSITRTGFGMAGDISAFVKARNESLLDHDMGFGEYAYIYVIAYYSWLGHEVTEGPGERSSAEPRAGTSKDSAGSTDAEEKVPDVGYVIGRDMAREVYGGRVRKMLITILENQRQQWEQAGDDPEAVRWRERLQRQIAALEAERLRVPWADGLPEETAASLEPYRQRLEASYTPATNTFELMQEQEDEDGFGLQFR